MVACVFVWLLWARPPPGEEPLVGVELGVVLLADAGIFV